jgi:hypothetical protein
MRIIGCLEVHITNCQFCMRTCRIICLRAPDRKTYLCEECAAAIVQWRREGLI